MATTSDATNYETVLRDLAIPPRPEVVTVLIEEKRKDEPDLNRVAKSIVADPGLTAGLLRAANSPYFGLTRKVSSVPQAVKVLGLRHVADIATGLALRHALKGSSHGHSFERFWNTAEKTAVLCHLLARKLKGIAADEAYTFALFHDCGIPVLVERFPAYRQAIVKNALAGDRPFVEAEEVETGTSHSILGYFLARSWLLPDDLCQAVLLHHDLAAFADAGVPDAVRNLIGCVHLAEHLLSIVTGARSDSEWQRFSEAVTGHFGLSDEDEVGLVDSAYALLGTDH